MCAKIKIILLLVVIFNIDKPYKILKYIQYSI
jgi:hypothetical protein